MAATRGKPTEGEPQWWLYVGSPVDEDDPADLALAGEIAETMAATAREITAAVKSSVRDITAGIQAATAPNAADRGETGMTSVRADMACDVVADMEALARLSERTPAAELNHAASFWIYVRRIVSEGGAVLVRDRRGKVGKVDLAGSTEPPEER
jgi:hypothetical protein